jgi:hypothetical protein
VIHRHILAHGEPLVIACDAQCEKAWGINTRPRVNLSSDEDDYAFLADGELFKAPINPGTYEGGHGKPQLMEERLNKWCFRECERCAEGPTLNAVTLPDFSGRVYNIPQTTP